MPLGITSLRLQDLKDIFYSWFLAPRENSSMAVGSKQITYYIKTDTGVHLCMLKLTIVR